MNPNLLNLTDAIELAHRSRKFKAQIPVDHGSRRGRCYELAGRYVVADVDAGCILHHGSIFNPMFSLNGPIFHAWVSVPPEPGSKLPVELWWKYDPVADLMLPGQVHSYLFNPIELARYEEWQIRSEMLRSGHWGPWAPALCDEANLKR